LLVLTLFLLLSACSTSPRHEQPIPLAQPVPVRPSAPVCHECGRIARVEMVGNVRATPGGGVVLGGVVGGVVSAPAPASAVAKAGVQVLTFKIGVQMDDGRRLILHQAELASGLRTGSRVRVVGGRVLAPR
jgi:hypothetical protein